MNSKKQKCSVPDSFDSQLTVVNKVSKANIGALNVMQSLIPREVRVRREEKWLR
jgi:hypothetical protein